MRVRSTADFVENTIINVDTVYLRSDIRYITGDDFEGWEYNEDQISKDEFISFLKEETDSLKKSQSESNTSLLELTEMLILGGM